MIIKRFLLYLVFNINKIDCFIGDGTQYALSIKQLTNKVGFSSFSSFKKGCLGNP